MKVSTRPTNVLLFLVGVSPATVAGDQFTEVRIRYVVLALVTIMVAMLAGNSMGFAVYTLTESVRAYAVTGVIWFLVILTIESFLIVSLKPNLTFASVFAILMRFLMAILISQLVSAPLELHIFKREIRNEQSISSARELSDGISYFGEEYKDKLAGLNGQKQTLENQIEAIRVECKNKYDAYIGEWKGVKAEGFTGVPGRGRWTELNKMQYERCQEELLKEENENINGSKAAHLKAVKDQINSVEQEHDARLENRKAAIEANTGLLAQIKALHRITEQNSEAKFKVWLLRLFILILETLPLSGKLFMLFSPTEVFRLTKENMTLQFEAKKLKAISEKNRQQEITKLVEALKEQEFARAYLLAAYAHAEQSSEFEVARRQRAKDIVNSLYVKPTTQTTGVNTVGEPAANGSPQATPPTNGRH
ncbi:MAG TPA: DUF4407 domain-containing protein [Pyrinomonadaceae bacterium]